MIIAPALRRGQANEASIEDDIRQAKAAKFEQDHAHEHTSDVDGAPATIDPDVTSTSSPAVEVGDDDDGDAA